MDKFLYLISEGLKNLWRHKVTGFTATFSLFLALYFVGLLIAAGSNTHKILEYLRTKYKIEVFFKQNVSNEEAIGVVHNIKKLDGIRNATLIQKDDAVRIFQDQYGENIVDILGYNPLPVSAVVNLVRVKRQPIEVERIIKDIRQISQVDEVRYQGNLIKKIERTYQQLNSKLPYFASILILIAVLVIYNTVKLSVYSRKDLISTLQLIGASNLFVKMPFIFEGMFIGLFAVILVFPAIIGTVEGANYFIDHFTSWGIKFSLDLNSIFWLFGIVILVTFIGGYRAASNFLK